MASKNLNQTLSPPSLAIGCQSQFGDHREKGKWETSKGSQCRRKTASRRFHLWIQLLLSQHKPCPRTQRHNPAKCKTATRSLCLRRALQLVSHTQFQHLVAGHMQRHAVTIILNSSVCQAYSGLILPFLLFRPVFAHLKCGMCFLGHSCNNSLSCHAYMCSMYPGHHKKYWNLCQHALLCFGTSLAHTHSRPLQRDAKLRLGVCAQCGCCSWFTASLGTKIEHGRLHPNKNRWSALCA
ncbi:unnamed protein product [Ixodes pacificus]